MLIALWRGGIPTVCSGSRHRHRFGGRETADKEAGLEVSHSFWMCQHGSSRGSDEGFPQPAQCFLGDGQGTIRTVSSPKITFFIVRLFEFGREGSLFFRKRDVLNGLQYCSYHLLG